MPSFLETLTATTRCSFSKSAVARVGQQENGRLIYNSPRQWVSNRIRSDLLSELETERRTEHNTSATKHGTRVTEGLEKPCDPHFGVKLHLIQTRNERRFH